MRKVNRKAVKIFRPRRAIKTKEGLFEELVLKIEPEACILREGSIYTIIRPRIASDPCAAIPRVILSGMEYNPEAAWRSALHRFFRQLEIVIPVGATRGEVRKLVDTKIGGGCLTTNSD